MPARRLAVRPSLLLLVLALASCAASARDKVLSTSLVALNSARDGLVTYSKEHELAIVAAATSEPDGKAKLASFRVKVDEVVTALEGAYLAIAAAVVINDDRSLAGAVSAIALVEAAWLKLRGGAP